MNYRDLFTASAFGVGNDRPADAPKAAQGENAGQRSLL
jgi:hypothetical protein